MLRKFSNYLVGSNRIPKSVLKKLLVISLIFTACTEIRLVGDYDLVTDLGIQQVQNDVSGLLASLKKNVVNNEPAANAYENYKGTYNKIDGEIVSLQIRCGALPKYGNVLKQINLLDSNLVLLEKFHKTAGIKDTLTIAVLRRTMTVSFRSMIVVQNALKRESKK